MSIDISLSFHITQPQNYFPLDFIFNLCTPSLLKHINSFYIMSLLQVFRISTKKCNTILRLINGSLASLKQFMEDGGVIISIYNDNKYYTYCYL